ncbi:MAG: phosphotriesterase family protein [Terrimicrobiaceae bacterium]
MDNRKLDDEAGQSAASKQDEVKKAQSVMGLVHPDDLGITLPHEHLLIDVSVWFEASEEAGLKDLADQPVRIENLGRLMFNQYSCRDNMLLQDESVAVNEAILFRKRGGSTIVDVTTIGLGRDLPALKRIAQATGLNIIAGSGYYVLRGEDAEAFDKKSEEEIAEEMVSEILVGFGDTGIRAGIIGEIGCSSPLQEREKKSLRAAARAQQATGAAITIHPGRHEHSLMETIKVLESAGADISRVIMGHIDRTGFLPATIREVAATGCYLEYDLFGSNPFYPLRFGVFRRPCDRERIEQIKELIDEGYLNQILISQDICLKTKLVRYGGTGYAHILCNILPQMLARGITQAHIHAMMVESPRRLLCFI